MDVLCAGLVVADHVCAPINRIPPAGELELTDWISLTIGGCAANAAVDLVKLGVSAAVAGCVGDDVLGRHVSAELESQGVDCSQIVRLGDSQTATTMVVNVRGEDRRFIHAAGANTEFTGREIDRGLLRRIRALYVGGFGLNPQLSGDAVASLFRDAREAGVVTLLDVVVGALDVWPMLEPALPFTDLFLPNEDEARVITGLSEPVEQARRFREAGAKAVVVTRGPAGALLSEGERLLEVPAHPVEQVDGTGGGDAFLAGIIYGLLNEYPLETCLQYGSAMGASCVQASGATTGVFNREQLEDFVAAHPLAVVER